MVEMIFNKNYDEVFDACLKALKELEINIETSDKENKTITGNAKASFLSWGENIQIIFEKINQYSTKIKVESSSVAQLIDWGKSSQNEESIIQTVKNIIEK